MLARNKLCRIPIVAGMCLTLLLLGGCKDSYNQLDYLARSDKITPEAGNAIAHNNAVHRIDPWPPESADTQIDVDGERMRGGIERYRRGESRQPRGLSTQSVSGN